MNADDWTDERLRKLERRIEAEYGEAARDMSVKSKRFLDGYSRRRERMLAAIEAGKVEEGEYARWLRREAVLSKRYRSMLAELSDVAEHAAEKASSMVSEELPTVFAENANRQMHAVEVMARVDTSFSLMSAAAVSEVMRRGDRLFRPMSHDSAKVRVWTNRKLTSALTQGLLQGESVPNIAKRMRSVYESDSYSAVRAARTAVTGAENAGRMNSLDRAKSLGIDVMKRWRATEDHRTRKSHRSLDGTEVPVEEPFQADDGELMFPGDPAGPASEVYNCRCTLEGVVPVQGNDAIEEDFETWVEEHLEE